MTTKQQYKQFAVSDRVPRIRYFVNGETIEEHTVICETPLYVVTADEPTRRKKKRTPSGEWLETIEEAERCLRTSLAGKIRELERRLDAARRLMAKLELKAKP